MNIAMAQIYENIFFSETRLVFQRYSVKEPRRSYFYFGGTCYLYRRRLFRRHTSGRSSPLSPLHGLCLYLSLRRDFSPISLRLVDPPKRKQWLPQTVLVTGFRLRSLRQWKIIRPKHATLLLSIVTRVDCCRSTLVPSTGPGVIQP